MNPRDGYPSGVPCWVDLETSDADAAIEFYRGVFNWTFEDRLPTDAPARYAIATVDELSVAAVGSARPGATGHVRWNTYVAVDDADQIAGSVWAAGGQVLSPPEDIGPAGRMAIIADPAGAELRLWQAGTNRGAQLVNADDAWNWSNLEVGDPAAVVDFYATVFGWELVTVDVGGFEAAMWTRPGYGDFLAADDPDLCERQDESGAPPGFADAIAWLMPLPAGGQPRWSVTFAVGDAAATARRAAELGGAVLVEPYRTGPTDVAVVADPHGVELTVSHFDPELLTAT